MPEYSQTGRPLRVDSKLGTDVLLLAGLEGRESVSGLFEFRLSLLSANPGINSRDMLGSAMVVSIDLPDGSTRKIHGLVRRFAQLERTELLTAYEAEIVPWLWLLSLHRDSRVFQEMTALEIIEQVFHDRKQSDFEIRCSGSFPKREYCVQYGESDLDFVSRLMEAEGIFYFFEHTQEKHTLVLGNTPSNMPECPGGTKVRLMAQHGSAEDVVTAVRRESSVALGKVSLRAYDYTQPAMKLESSLSGQGEGELYEYPGGFTTVENGDRDAGLILESHEALRDILRGEGSCRNFVSGHRFELSDHFASEANAEYVLLDVEHSARVTGYFSSADAEYQYRNAFLAVPAAVKYRPPRATPRPVVRGTQTAVVVGPSGEEIYVDKYGRVKVQFFWDRVGKKNEKSSCWVRVSSAWAGKGWGAMQIPRIGQEVVVDFLEGDPDHPIITGRVYNAEQMPPYELPANQTTSGFKSRSAKEGSGENANEIRLEDKKGAELLLIHAEKDAHLEVEHDRIQKVDNDETVTVKGKRTKTVDGSEDLTVGGDLTRKVKANETVHVDGNAELNVKGKRTVQVTGDDTLSSDANVAIGAISNVSVKSKAGGVEVEGITQIELKVGDNQIVIGPEGIHISGLLVTIEAQNMTNISGGEVQIGSEIQTQVGGPITMVQAESMLQLTSECMAAVNGSAMVQVQGGMVMIN